MSKVSDFDSNIELQKGSGGRVAAQGATAWVNTQEANRSLKEVTSDAANLYARAFLKYATTGLPASSKSPDLAFYTDKLPSHVFFEELFKEEVNDGVFIVEGGLKIDHARNCYANLYYMVEEICRTGVGVLETSPDLVEDDFVNELTKQMSGRELYNVKATGLLNMKKVLIEYMLGHGRDEAGDYTLMDIVKLFYKAANAENFNKVAGTILYSLVTTFSKQRTDLIIWGAPVQVTEIEGARWSRGTVAIKEEDGGKMYNDCYSLYRLSAAISMKNFLNTPDGSPFRADPNTKAAQKAYGEWAFKPKEKRLPWKQPKPIPIHFALSSKAQVSKDLLQINSGKGQPEIEFGYFTSSLGESGKLNKLQTAMVTGRTNDDPDVAFMFNSYLTSEDKGTASKNMTAEEITSDKIKECFTHIDIMKSFMVLATDTQHKKVRVYDEFAMNENLSAFRRYLLAEGQVEGTPKPIDLINPTEHEHALELLGINLATNIDDIVSGVTNSAGVSQNQTVNAMNAAMNQAMIGGTGETPAQPGSPNQQAGVTNIPAQPNAPGQGTPQQPSMPPSVPNGPAAFPPAPNTTGN